MRKHTKLIALLLAFIMVFTLAVHAFAAGNTWTPELEEHRKLIYEDFPTMVTSRHDGKRSISDTAYYCGLIFYVPPGSKPGGIFCVNAAFSPSP